MLVEAFKSTIFPYFIQLSKILFVYTIALAAYSVMKTSNWQKLLDSFKVCIVGYMISSGAFTILDFIDKIIKTIKV